jgi:hypothetical protein
MLYVMRVVALPIVCQAKRSRSFAAVALLCAVACARTGLYPGELGDSDLGSGDTSNGGTSNGSHDGGKPSAGSAIGGGGAGAGAGGVPIQAPPMSGAAPIATAGASTTPVGNPPSCVAVAETCNGRDDDCDGAVDNLPAEACPGGGFRFCVAGRLSECPRRCDVCVPGSVRVCENSFCSFWGEQECAADGQGFGNCREALPPPECKDIAKKFENSRQLEQCCLDNGYCCLDQHDLNGNGNRREMLGACGDVACQ